MCCCLHIQIASHVVSKWNFSRCWIVAAGERYNKYNNDDDWYEWSVLFNSGVVDFWNCVTSDGWMSEWAWNSGSMIQTGRPKCLEKNLSHFQFVHFKSCMALDWKLIHGFCGESPERLVPGLGQDVSEECFYKHMIQTVLKVKSSPVIFIHLVPSGMWCHVVLNTTSTIDEELPYSFSG